MAWEEEVVEEEEYGEEMEALDSEDEAEDVVVGQMPTVMVPKHINKRSLKNKALSVTLDKKALKDFVTGFHKRKKKRRKEAQKILQEKERKKRIHDRKRVKPWTLLRVSMSGQKRRKRDGCASYKIGKLNRSFWVPWSKEGTSSLFSSGAGAAKAAHVSRRTIRAEGFLVA